MVASVVYGRNARHQITSVSETNLSTTYYATDANCNRLYATDPLGHVTSYPYHPPGPVVSVTDPLDHSTLYTYDAAGQTVGITDRNGRQRTFEYNDLGLRTSEVWLDEENDPVRTITRDYDYAGRLTL